MNDNENIKASPDDVATITNFIMENGVEKWLDDNPGTRLIDLFMAAHNVHRFIVQTIAMKWAPTISERQTYHMADMTFRKTIKELREASLKPQLQVVSFENQGKPSRMIEVAPDNGPEDD